MQTRNPQKVLGERGVKRGDDYRGENKRMLWNMPTVNTQIKEYQMHLFASQSESDCGGLKIIV